jgi:acetyltransferase-like isoleucine patch superfamily enzyme
LKTHKTNLKKMGKGCRLYGRIDPSKPDIISLGDYVVFGAGSNMVTHCPISFYKEGENFEIIIGNNVYIGYGCLILPGAKIGDNVMIGAGSVVAGKIPSNSIAVGNPCRVVRPMTEKEALRMKLMTDQGLAAVGQEPVYKEGDKL